MGQQDPLENEMATHSSILAWRIPWTKEPDRLQSTGLQSPTWLSNFTFFSLFLSFKRESCTKAPVGHLHFPLEGSNKPGYKNMSSREEPNWFLSVKRAEQGDAHVWEQGETWHFHKCPELLGVTSLKILPGLGVRLSSSGFTKAWEDEEDRYFFFLVMKKNDTQTDSYTFCQYCLCFKSGERQMNAEDSGCATKKCVSLSKILYKKTLYRSFIAQSWLSGQYASKVVKSLLIHFKMITELKTPKTQI